MTYVNEMPTRCLLLKMVCEFIHSKECGYSTVTLKEFGYRLCMKKNC